MIEMVELPYDLDALEPYISRKQIDLHYNKHYKKYVDTTTDLIKGTPLEDVDLEDIMQLSSGELGEQSAQAWNHTFYFKSMIPSYNETSPGFESTLPEDVEIQLVESFASLEYFKESFQKKVEEFFGVGWIWLTMDEEFNLEWITTPDELNPLISSGNRHPILCCDLWEHAYYLDYYNDKATYTNDWLNHLANWDFASQNISLCIDEIESSSNDKEKEAKQGKVRRTISASAFKQLLRIIQPTTKHFPGDSVQRFHQTLKRIGLVVVPDTVAQVQTEPFEMSVGDAIEPDSFGFGDVK